MSMQRYDDHGRPRRDGKSVAGWIVVLILVFVGAAVVQGVTEALTHATNGLLGR